MLTNQCIKPRYDAACFSNIPSTLTYLLTARGTPGLPVEVLGGLPETYDTIIFLFIDAFGWRFFERYRDRYAVLERFSKDGVAAKLTSQFPSTTAAHVTCIHTGLSVGQSGIYEWQYYEPELDAIIAPLLFSPAGTRQREVLKSAKVQPQNIYPSRTIHQDLQQQGVASYVFQHRDYATSTYTQAMCQGATVVPYKTLSEALVNLRCLMAQQESKAYYHLYFDNIDTICHQYGPNSPHLEAEIDTLLTILERWFQRDLSGPIHNTLCMLTADHGQIEVDPRSTIYLNREPRFAGLQRYLKTNRAGALLVPAGSCRDLFLYIKDELLDEAHAFLAERLHGAADVWRAQELVDQGFFGPAPVSPVLLARLGNLVILPDPGQTVWWYVKDKFEQKSYGHHGGLTPQEMEIPLLLYNFPA